MRSMTKSIMIIFISFLFISSIFNVQSATTRKSDVRSSVDSPTNYQTDVSSVASKATIVGESLASPSDTRQFAPVPEGVIIEPVPINDNIDTTQTEDGIPILIKDDNLMIKPNEEDVKIPILIKDDNLIIKPKEEDVHHPILIRDDNLMIQPGEEVILEPVPIRDDNLMIQPGEEVILEPVPIRDDNLMIQPGEEVILEPVPIRDDNLMIQPGEEVILEPVPIRDDNLMIQPGEDVILEPVPIRDDNLMIQPEEEVVLEPVPIRDDNLMIQPEKEVVLEPVPIKDNNITVKNNIGDKTKDSVSVIPQPLNNEKTELITPTTPTPLSSSVSDHSFGQVIKPCPDFESRYENGQFIVTLDDGKCEMIVSENIITQNKRNQWATGRYTPIYQLLSRKYKPKVTFRQTSLAPEGQNCRHRTRQTGTFFVVDTVVGRCQMVIGIPTLPDLKNAFANANTNMANPGWNRPVRRMPTWPRKSSSTGSDSDD